MPVRPDKVAKIDPTPPTCVGKTSPASSSLCKNPATYLINGDPHCADHAVKYFMYRAQQMYKKHERFREGVKSALKEPTETHLFASLDKLLNDHPPEVPPYDEEGASKFDRDVKMTTKEEVAPVYNSNAKQRSDHAVKRWMEESDESVTQKMKEEEERFLRNVLANGHVIKGDKF